MTEKKASFFPTTHLTLIESLRDEQSPRWEVFFELYGPIVYQMGRHSGLSPNDAEEVVAQVMRNFVQAMRGGFEVDHRLGRFRSYLRTIANREINRQRQRIATAEGRDEHLDRHADAGGPPGSAAPGWSTLEMRERLRMCLEELRRSPPVSARDLEAFERYALRGEPAAVVAREMGVSVNRLYGIKHEMIVYLREMSHRLDDEIGEVGA